MDSFCRILNNGREMSIYLYAFHASTNLEQTPWGKGNQAAIIVAEPAHFLVLHCLSCYFLASSRCIPFDYPKAVLAKFRLDTSHILSEIQWTTTSLSPSIASLVVWHILSPVVHRHLTSTVAFEKHNQLPSQKKKVVVCAAISN